MKSALLNPQLEEVGDPELSSPVKIGDAIKVTHGHVVHVVALIWHGGDGELSEFETEDYDASGNSLGRLAFHRLPGPNPSGQVTWCALYEDDYIQVQFNE